MDASVIEAMLLRWGESPTGRTVTFLLPEDTPNHPFKGLRTGPTHGQRLALSIALIADDETQSPPADNQPKEKKRSRAQEAGILCNDARFQAYLRGQWHSSVNSAEEAKQAIYALCGIHSRTELDGDPKNERYWDRLVGSYKAWLAVAA